MKVAYGDDDDQKSFQQMQGLIQAYPNLKGVISPTTVGVAAAARYLSTSPEKGKVKLTGLGFPNQMRKFVDDGTVDEFQLWVPKDVGYLAGQAAAALVAGRITGKQGETFTAGRLGKYTIGAEQRDRARPADDVQQGEHRQVRLLGAIRRARPMTRPAPTTIAPASTGARAPGAGRGLRDRARGLLGAVRRAARAHPGLPAARRGARRASSAREVVSAGLVDTREGAREAGDRFARGQVDLVLCHAVTYATSSQVLPAVQAAKAPVVLLGLQPTRDARLREHRHGRVAGQLRGVLRAGARGGVHARAASPTTPSPGRSTTTSAPGRRSARGCARPASRASLRRSRIGFLGHTYPGMLDMYSDFTTVHAQLGAHVEVLEIDDLGARVAAATDAEVDGARRPRSARCSTSPTRRTTRSRADRAATSSTGRRASPSASTGSSRTSSSTRSPTTTAALDGNEAERLGAGVIVGNSLLTARGDPDRGRGRPEDERRPADPRPARRGRLVHRVLRARLQRGLRPHGPRRPDARRDRRGPADAARAAALPRQARRRAQRRVQGPLRPDHDRRLHPDRRRRAEAARRRGRVDPRRDVPHRQHEQPPAVRPPARRVLRGLVRRGPDPPRRARRRPVAGEVEKVASLLGLPFARVG